MPRRKSGMKRISHVMKKKQVPVPPKKQTTPRTPKWAWKKKSVPHKQLLYKVTSGGKNNPKYGGGQSGMHIPIKSTRGLKTKGSKARKNLAQKVRSTRHFVKRHWNVI